MGEMRSTRELLPKALGALAEQSGSGRSLSLPWADVVGPATARASRPVALAEGVLEVEADTRAWAQELERNAQEILRRLNDHTGLSLTALRVRIA